MAPGATRRATVSPGARKASGSSVWLRTAHGRKPIRSRSTDISRWTQGALSPSLAMTASEGDGDCSAPLPPPTTLPLPPPPPLPLPPPPPPPPLPPPLSPLPPARRACRGRALAAKVAAMCEASTSERKAACERSICATSVADTCSACRPSASVSAVACSRHGSSRGSHAPLRGLRKRAPSWSRALAVCDETELSRPSSSVPSPPSCERRTSYSGSVEPGGGSGE